MIGLKLFVPLVLLASMNVTANTTNITIEKMNQMLDKDLQIRILRKNIIAEQVKSDGIQDSETLQAFMSQMSYQKYQWESQIRDLETQSSLLRNQINATPTQNLKLTRFLPLYYRFNQTQYVSQVSFYNPTRMTENPKSAFYHQQDEGMSALTTAASSNYLVDPLEAFNRKVEILTGRKIPAQFLREANFAYSLDFTKAPRLKSLLVSSLFLRGDYTGRIMEQILKFHRSRGTDVRVMVSATATWALGIGGGENVAKDNGILSRLEAANIPVQRVRYNSPNANVHEFSSLHRAHHAKLIVIEDSDSSKSKIIVGGRNLSDAYVFMSAPNHSRFKDLVQYSSLAYTPVEDLEIELTGSELMYFAKAQFNDFWNRPALGIVNESAFISLPLDRIADSLMNIQMRQPNRIYTRHFFTSPFFGTSNRTSLENIFIQSLKSAKRKIRIVTPYFNPPPAMVEALQKKIEEGVEVEILTNLVFGSDDYSPAMVAAANRFGLQRLLDTAKIYTWSANTMFHSKAMCIDNELTYIGSANMNRRSFSHDVENGVFIHDPQTCRQFNDIFENRYLPNAKRVTGAEVRGQSRVFNDTLISILRDLF